MTISSVPSLAIARESVQSREESGFGRSTLGNVLFALWSLSWLPTLVVYLMEGPG